MSKEPVGEGQQSRSEKTRNRGLHPRSGVPALDNREGLVFIKEKELMGR